MISCCWCRCLGRRERDYTKESFTLASFARCCNAELCPCSPPSCSHTHTSTHTHSHKTKRQHAVSQSQSVGERNLHDGCPLAGRCALGTHASLPHTSKVACLRSDSFLHPSIPPSIHPSHLSIIAAKVCRSQHATLALLGDYRPFCLRSSLTFFPLHVQQTATSALLHICIYQPWPTNSEARTKSTPTCARKHLC